MATTSQSNALETPIMVMEDTGTEVTVFICVPGMRKKSGLLARLKRCLRLKPKSPFSLASNIKFGQYALTNQSLKLVAEVYPDKAAMHKRSEDHTRYECNIEQFPSQINAESATFDVEQNGDNCYIVLSCMKTNNYSTNWEDFLIANGTLDLTKVVDSPPYDAAANSLLLEEQTDFVVNLLREVSKDGRSCVVSPFFVAVALSMAYAGAKEQTKEIGQLLAKSAPESALHAYLDELVKAFKKRSCNYTLEVANKLYVVDFEQRVESAKKINKFVEKETHDKIRDLIKPDMLGDMTRLVLINAVYFRGQWVDNFDNMFTRKKTFHIDKNTTKEVDMLWAIDMYIYFEDDQLQLLGMPYKGGQLFMFVLLPKERFGLAKMLAKLDGKSLLELVKKRSKQLVQVELPKFKLESTYDLNGPLTKLGMSTAFSNSANFEGITTGDALKISKVVQKASIEVRLTNMEVKYSHIQFQ